MNLFRWSAENSGFALPLGTNGSNSNKTGVLTKRRLRLLALLALISATLLLLIFYFGLFTDESIVLGQPLDRAENDSTGDRRKYGVVIDAGSSGSRAMIYAWDDPSIQSNSTKGLPKIERAGKEWTFKTSPGISSFADKPQRLGIDHLKPLLDFATKHIPKRQVASTPVYLLATAGMRLLPQAHQSLLLDTACSFARDNYDFYLPDCVQDNFKVVSGELEGLYGWVAVNYLMDGFLDSSKHSLGFLDMGGASAQIAFEPAKKAAQIHKHDLAKVTLRNLNGQDFNHDIFVATFLGHGTNEARRRYVELLKPISGLPVVKDDPCLLNGLALPTLDNKLVLKGSGSFEECVRATEPLLNKTICPIEPCLFAGVHAPEIDFGTQQFVGVSEYWYASNDYLQLGGVWDIQNFEQKAAEFCKQPWSHITSKYNINNDPLVVGRLQMQCFKAAWLVNVLHNGFGIPRIEEEHRQKKSIFQSVNQVGDVEVSWTLGALLLKVCRTIKPNYQTTKLSSIPGIVLPQSIGVNEHSHDHDGVELKDDSLWSPLKFVGLKKFMLLWSLQPVGMRILLVAIALFTIGIFAGLVYWVCKHRRRKNGIAYTGIPLSPLAPNNGNSVHSPSQLGLSERMYADEENIVVHGKPIKKSSSMFVMDVLSRPLQAAGVNMRSHPSTPKLRALQIEDSDSAPKHSSSVTNLAEYRARNAGLAAAEDTAMSRSSSVNSLVLLNRRRGGGPD